MFVANDGLSGNAFMEMADVQGKDINYGVEREDALFILVCG